MDLPHERIPGTVWRPIRKLLFRFPAARLWVIRRSDARALKKLRDKYLPLVQKARAAKNAGDVKRLESEWSTEQLLVLEPTSVLESDLIVAKARRYGITVAPIPSDDEETEDWKQTFTTYEWILADTTAQRLRKEIREEKRSDYDEYRKWITTLLALAGFVLALVSLLMKQKQPDPCPRNYYRDDAGACVFALPPTPQPQGQQPKQPQVPAATKPNRKQTP